MPIGQPENLEDEGGLSALRERKRSATPRYETLSRAPKKDKWMPTWAAPSSSKGSHGLDEESRVGYRTIIFSRRSERAVFAYGFAKSDRANIDADEEKQFKQAARHVLHLTEKQIDELVKNGDFVEMKYEEEISK
jgi:hypothetical protein